MAPAILPDGAFAKLALLVIVVGVLAVLRKGVPKAYGLSLIMVAAFTLDVISRLTGNGGTQEALGFQVSAFFAGAEWWSPLTSIFVHAPFAGGSIFQLHIIGNLLILVAAGPPLEARIGEKWFLIIFFAAGFGALVAHTILALATSIVHVDDLAIGASGAIFGVLTAFAVRHPREPLPVLLIFFLVSLPAFAVLLIYLGLNLMYMLTITNVAWWGHFAGFLIGLPFAYVIPRDAALAKPGTRAAARGLPDPEKLAPLATSNDTREILDRIRQFTPETRTADDRAFVDAWLDRFFAKATCDQGHRFVRDGLTATCEGGEQKVEFGRK